MSDDVYLSESPEPTSLDDILYAMREAGGVRAAVLASMDGLLIASASNEYDSDTMAAIVALLQKVGVEMQQQLGLPEIDEVTVRTLDHTRLACRRIHIGEETLILVAIAPPGQPYRRATNHAIFQIRQLLS